jgi:hypothetical protein
MRPIDPIFDHPTQDWFAAAQEAAFEGRCFCLRSTGRFVNREAMPEGTPHSNPFDSRPFTTLYPTLG